MSSVNGLDFSMSNNAWADELSSIVAVKVVPLIVIFICFFLYSQTYSYFRLFERLQVIMADCVIVEIVCSLTGVII